MVFNSFLLNQTFVNIMNIMKELIDRSMLVELPSADAKLAGITNLAKVQSMDVQDVFRTKKSGKKKEFSSPFFHTRCQCYKIGSSKNDVMCIW
jgi:hypothetical protein